MKESIFGSVPIESVRKARFDLSHDVKLTGNMAKLIPVLMEECLPGENWKWNGNLLLRFAPLLAPVMHRVHATFHCYHVPNRILTTVWKNAITGGEDGEFSTSTPYIEIDTLLSELQDQEPGNPGIFAACVGEGSLWDYLGMPTFSYDAGALYQDDTQINVLPWLAYVMIWQYYYKDQNWDASNYMQQPIAGGALDIGQFINIYSVLRNRAWEKDAYTSALPWPQRGPDVLLPFDSIVDEIYDKVTGQPNTQAGDLIAGNVVAGGDGIFIPAGAVPQVEFRGTNGTFTINDMRTAIVVQQWLEINARGGSRYNEVILSHFDERVPDFRLDQPEYIGGSKQRVQFSEVLTSANSMGEGEVNVPPATMVGHGISVGGSNSFFYQVKEHGWMVVILSVLPETSYQQGIPRKFTRIDRMDYAWPAFAGLGEQEVLYKEVYFDPEDDGTLNNALFGYQQRFWEYKSIPNRTCGEFKTTLDFWTMTRIFDQRPDNGLDFVYADPTERIFATNDASHKLWMQVVHQLSVLRPLPYYSVPGVLKL